MRGSSREKVSGAAWSVAWRLPGKAATGWVPRGAAGPTAEAAPGRGRSAASLPRAVLGRASRCVCDGGGGGVKVTFTSLHS